MKPSDILKKSPKPALSLLGTWYLVLGTLLSCLSCVFATLFTLSGIRRTVVARNFALIGRSNLRKPRFFRWKLAFHLFQDALSLIFPRFSPVPCPPSLSPSSQSHLTDLRRGPSVLLAAHYHNWEAQASWLGRLGVPLLGAARPLTAPWADRLLRSVRARNGVPVVTDGVPRAALRHLRAGGCFGFLWDQHSPNETSPSGTFFGHPVRLNPLPLSLLAAEPCPVYFGVWLPGGELRILPLLRDFHEGWQMRLERRYHRVLETLVRRHPTYWYGFLHARFKNLGPYRGHRDG